MTFDDYQQEESLMKSTTQQLLATCALFAACLIASIAHATDYSIPIDEANPTTWVSVELLGVHPGLAFVRFQSGASIIPQAMLPVGVACQNAVFYMDTAQVHGKLIYQQLLVAKTAGKKMSRVNFVQDGANTLCYLSLVGQIE